MDLSIGSLYSRAAKPSDIFEYRVPRPQTPPYSKMQCTVNRKRRCIFVPPPKLPTLAIDFTMAEVDVDRFYDRLGKLLKHFIKHKYVDSSKNENFLRCFQIQTFKVIDRCTTCLSTSP